MKTTLRSLLALSLVILFCSIQRADAQFVQQGVINTGVASAGVSNSVSISADGNTAIIAGSGNGSAFIYTYSGSAWAQQASLTNTGAAGTSTISVAISGDGNTAMIGALNDNGGIGATWVWTRSGSSWTQQAKLVGTVGTGVSIPITQGASLALSYDGNTAIIGAPNQNGLSTNGASFIWTRSGATWAQQAMLVGTATLNSGIYGTQGWSVSLSGDGNTAIVGDPSDNARAGAAWVWKRKGVSWTQQAKLIGSGTVMSQSQGTQQGSSVAISFDGNTVIVGGIGDGDITNPVYITPDIGAAWIWTNSGGSWVQQANLQSSRTVQGQPYLIQDQGWSVSLSGDGNTALISPEGDGGSFSMAFVWTRSGASWTEQPAIVTGGISSASTSLSLSAKGNTAIIADQGTVGQGLAGAYIYSSPANAGGNNKMVSTAGDYQTTLVNNAFGTPLSVTLTNASYMPLVGVQVTFVAPASGASGTFSNSANSITVTTDANGVANAGIFTANATAGGPYVISATLQGTALSANFNLTNNSTAPTGSVLSLGSDGTATLCSGPSNIIVAITGGTAPYTIVYSDGTISYTVNNYVSGTDIQILPTSTTTYSLVSVTDAAGKSGTNNTGTATVTISTNLVVTTTADAGLGSLRQALVNACNGSTITFAPNVAGTISLAQTLSIDKGVTIKGPGANVLTVSGNNAFQVFDMSNCPAAVSISGLTIANGFYNNYSGGGGGINARPTNNSPGSYVPLTVSQCSFINNNSGYGNTGGGAIFGGNPLTVTGCTFTGNVTSGATGIGGGEGGAIASPGPGSSFVNSTFSGNSALGGEGGSSIYSTTIITVTNCTTLDAWPFAVGGATISNSIIDQFGNGIGKIGAGGTLGGNLISGGYNIVSKGDVAYFTLSTGDQYGSSASPINLKLGPLQYNGGSTPTYALLPGSPAIDKGNCIASVTTDQRGVTRPQGSACDIGAYELQVANTMTANAGTTPQSTTVSSAFTNALAVTLKDAGGIPANGISVTFTAPTTGASGSFSNSTNTITVVTDANGVANAGIFTANANVGSTYTITATAGTLSTTFTLSNTCPTNLVVTNNNDAGPGSLRQAVLSACPGSTITFDMTQVVSPISLSGGQVIIDKNLTIQGPGANTLSIQNTAAASSTSRIFYVNTGVTAAISGLTITGGNTTGIGFVASAGGGIYNNGTLTLLNIILKNNSSSYGGGAILNYGGTLTLNSCTITGSSNAIRTYANGTTVPTTFINNSTIYGNSNHAIQNDYGTLTMTNCTLSGNTSTSGAAAIYNGQFGGTTYMYSCTVTGNNSDIGAGIYNVGGPFYLKNSIVAGNIQTITSVFEPDITGTVISQGYNLIGNIGATPFTPTTGDLVGTTASPINPLFDPSGLQDNGNTGGVQTIALLPGSPAIDAGTSTGALSTDQRGSARVGAVDIGAFESQGFTISVAGGNNQSAIINQAFTNPLSVTVKANSSSEPVNGGIVTFTVPGQTGPSCTITNGNVITIAGATATTGPVTANANPGGPYNVTATASGVGSPASFSLTNGNPATTTALSSSANPSVYGQSITFTATVSPVSGSGTPTGSVTFMDGTLTLGAAPLDVSGSASLATSSLGVGPHSVTAVYNGDGYFTGSSSPVINQVISIPAITTSTGSLTAFTACNGSSSAIQNFTVAGSNLGDNLVVTAPTGFEVSLDGNTFSSSVSLTPSSGTVAITTVLVRMASTASGTTSGNIACTSTDATEQDVQANGSVNPVPTLGQITVSPVCDGGSSVITLPGVGASGLQVTVNYTIGNVAQAPISAVINPDGSVNFNTRSLNYASDNNQALEVTNIAFYGTGCSYIFHSRPGNLANNAANLTVNPRPTAVITGGGKTCYGSSPAVTVTFTGTAPFSYQLSDGTTGSTSNNPATISVSLSSTTTYYVISLSDANCTSIAADLTGSATVTMNPRPTAVISGGGMICKGTSGSVVITFTGTAPFSYQLNDGTSGSTSNNPATITVLPSSTTTYYVTSLSDANCTSIATDLAGSATVTLNPLPTATISASGTPVCMNSASSPSVTFSGSGSTAPYTYTYSINGGTPQTITDNGSGNITIQAPTSAYGTFVYTLTSVQDASSTQCSQTITGQSATVAINPLPTATISGTTAVCQGTASPNVTFTGSGGTAPYTFTYSLFNGTTTTTGLLTASGNPVNVAVSTTTAGIYTYTLTGVQDANGCPQTVTPQSVQVTVNAQPSASISTASMVTAVSTGNVASVSNAGTGASYAWIVTNATITAGSGTNSITYSAGATGTVSISVSVTSPTGCGPVSSGILSIPITALPCPNPAITAPWIVCSASTGNTASVAKVSGSKYVWAISNGTITAGSGTNSISYTAGASGIVTLSATVTNASGQCTVSSGKYYVIISPLPSAAITANTSVCASSTGNVAYVPGCGLGSTYAWSISNGTITAGSGTSKITYTAGPSGTVTISVTVTNAAGCKASSGSKSVAISAYPVASITAASSVCASSSGNTASVASAGTGAKYAWNITNGWVTSGAGTSSITYTASKSGSVALSVTVTNSSGCSSTSANKTVSIVALPGATIITSSSVCAGSTGNTASVTAVTGGTYVWTISSGSTITSGNGTSSVKYTAPATGASLTISVTVTNSSGCKASYGSFNVMVNPAGTPTFAGIATLCLGAKAPVLPGKSLNGVTGTWSPTKINTSVTGITSYTFTPTAGQCAAAATMNIKVQDCNAAARVMNVVETSTAPAMDAILLPNPSHNQFTLVIKGNRKEIAKIIVYDILGRPIELLQANTGTAVKFGMGYLNGIYIVEVVQGTDRKLFKAVKQ